MQPAANKPSGTRSPLGIVKTIFEKIWFLIAFIIVAILAIALSKYTYTQITDHTSLHQQTLQVVGRTNNGGGSYKSGQNSGSQYTYDLKDPSTGKVYYLSSSDNSLGSTTSAYISPHSSNAYGDKSGSIGNIIFAGTG